MKIQEAASAAKAASVHLAAVESKIKDEALAEIAKELKNRICLLYTSEAETV